MKNKLVEKLSGLKSDLSNVSDRTINDISDIFAPLITDENIEQLDLGLLFKTLDGNINKITATAVETIKNQSKLDDKKPIKEEIKKEEIKENKKEEEMSEQESESALLRKELADLKAKLDQTEREKIANERRTIFNSKIDKAPEQFKKILNKNFDKISFNADDEFNSYLTDIETNIAEYSQSMAESGLNRSVPNTAKPKVNDGQTDALAKALEMLKK